MAIDPTIELADAIAADLNTVDLAAGFDLPSAFRGITITRGYLPQLNLATLEAAPQVFVIPKSEDARPASRRSQQADREIHIGVIQKLVRQADGTLDNAAIDNLLGNLCFAIKERLKFRRQGDGENRYGWIRTTHEPLFDTSHLDKYPQFTSLITVTYRRIED